TYAGSLAGLDRNDRMRTFSDTLEAVTDGDVTTSLRETKAGDVKLRSFKVVGRSNPFAKRSLGPRFGDDGVQDQPEQVAPSCRASSDSNCSRTSRRWRRNTVGRR